MEILVVAATTMEISPFLGRNKGHDHLITGVGVPATMYHLQKKLYSKKYDFVLQAGIAGSFTNDYEPGNCVVIERDVFADIGVRENHQFADLFDLSFAGKDDHPYTDGWLYNNHIIKEKSALEKVSAVTVNTVTDDKKVNTTNREKYQAAVESMEGAALHYLCNLENIPYLQIRSISNRVGDRDKARWRIKEAITRLDEELNNHLELLNK